MQAWLASELGLEHFPVAFTLLQDYALVSLVERKIEAVHAMIKKLGSGMTNVMPPYICARLREAIHLEMLRKSSEFFRFCVSRWRSWSMIDQLLALRITKTELKTLGINQKIKIVYQCSLDQEYENSSEQRAAQTQWLSLTNINIKVVIVFL